MPHTDIPRDKVRAALSEMQAIAADIRARQPKVYVVEQSREDVPPEFDGGEWVAPFTRFGSAVA